MFLSFLIWDVMHHLFLKVSVPELGNFPSVDVSISLVVVIETPIAWKASFYDNGFVYHYKFLL